MNNPLYDDSIFLNAVERKMMTGDELASAVEIIPYLSKVGVILELVEARPDVLIVACCLFRAPIKS
jgi:hypothetical protein